METRTQKPANLPGWYSTVLAVLLVLAILVWAASLVPRFLVGPAPAYGVTTQEGAWYACAAHIAEQFKFSFLDAQRYYPAGVTRISSDTYQARIAYSQQGRTVLCTIQHTSSGTWQLLELK